MRAREPDRFVWRKSSYSGNGSACVEVAWRKSSYSVGNGGCVEVASASGGVLVRDSKNPGGPVLGVDNREWLAFLSGFTTN